MVKKPMGTAVKKSFIRIAVLFCAAASIFFIVSSFNQHITDAKNIKTGSTFNETSSFLAGKELPEKSGLYQYSRTKDYAAYSKQIDSSWARLQDSNEKKIIQWKEKYLPKKYTATIYYPFSGPDILNALIFFPDGNEYIMFGLESPGDIPEPQNISQDKLYSGLNGLRSALNNVLNVNYFKTIEMGKDISTNSLNSITSVIMFFLARTGHEVLDVKKIWIDEKSQITATPKTEKKPGKMIPGSEITFKKAEDDTIKRLRYFQLNVIDQSLNIYTNFIPFLESQGRFTTFIKSASYLMHNEKKFIKIRNITLSHSDYILQDDSGIALRYFPADEWKLTFHGTYTKPVPLFVHRFQPDFDQAMKKHSTGPLPFSYGYNFKENESNLMFAQRIKK